VEDQSNTITALILGALAALSGLFLVISFLDPQGLIAGSLVVPGRVLTESLHVAALWVPIYLLVLAGFALSRRRMTWHAVILLSALHVPALTIATILRLAIPGPFAGGLLLDLLISGFSRRGAVLVVSLLLAVEGFGFLQLWNYLNRRRIRAGAASEGVRQLLAPQEGDWLDLDAETSDSYESRRLRKDEEPAVTEREGQIEGGQIEGGDIDGGEIHDEPTPETLDVPDVAATLEALRRRMAATDDEPETDSAFEPEPPLPLVLRARASHRPAVSVRSTALLASAKPLDDEETLDDELLDDETLGEVDLPGDDAPGDDAPDDEMPDEVDALDVVGVPDDDVLNVVGMPEEEDPELSLPPIGPTLARRRFGRPGRTGSRHYEVPVEGVLDQYADGRYWEIDDSTRDAAEVLRVTLEEFGIRAEVTGIRKGPVITMFEILPAPGVKLAKITNLSDNIALRLAASSVRIVAPIPGKHAVGIEIPNRQRHIVSFGELLLDDEFFGDSMEIPIALGKDISGEAQIVDLAKTPHMLIAGATGSGKSVCVNSIICSILYRRPPSEVKMILIDPKIVELKFYNDIPHLLTPVITDPKRAFQALQYLIYEMERRYSLLDSMGARDIAGFNARIKRKNLATEPLPYIVVIIDEFADLMATSGKELESTVARLAAMSRAVGIHIVLATQRPSTDVITGLIKANIPSRIAFMVASKVDSRIIIDSMGAEKLLGRGDMLFTSAADPFPIRMQGAFLSEDEVERVVALVKDFGEPEYIDDEIFIDDDEDELGGDVLEDPLLESAIEVVTTSRKASASYLQRRLKVGYNRAARMVEEMERLGLVGPQNGSKPREIIHS
jgi:DNA segregation ATPase FtsK/SpoIIIE, S-DNA-T family